MNDTPSSGRPRDQGLLLDCDLHVLDLAVLCLVQHQPQERFQEPLQRPPVIEPLPHRLEFGQHCFHRNVRGRLLPGGQLLRRPGLSKVPDHSLLRLRVEQQRPVPAVSEFFRQLSILKQNAFSTLDLLKGKSSWHQF